MCGARDVTLFSTGLSRFILRRGIDIDVFSAPLTALPRRFSCRRGSCRRSLLRVVARASAAKRILEIELPQSARNLRGSMAPLPTENHRGTRPNSARSRRIANPLHEVFGKAWLGMWLMSVSALGRWTSESTGINSRESAHIPTYELPQIPSLHPFAAARKRAGRRERIDGSARWLMAGRERICMQTRLRTGNDDGGGDGDDESRISNSAGPQKRRQAPPAQLARRWRVYVRVKLVSGDRRRCRSYACRASGCACIIILCD